MLDGTWEATGGVLNVTHGGAGQGEAIAKELVRRWNAYNQLIPVLQVIADDENYDLGGDSLGKDGTHPLKISRAVLELVGEK